MTDRPDPIRIPIGRNVTYAVRGMPAVANAYGPGFLVPTEVSLTYRAAEDSQLGRFHAYVKGHWMRDGEEVSTGEKLPGQHYSGDPANWPEWLAEEARLHDPDAAPTAGRDLRDLRDRIAQAVRQTVTRVMDLRGFDTQIADAVLAVLPANTDQTAAIRAVAFKTAALYVRGHSADERFGKASVSTALCTMSDELRRLADEARQEPTALHLGDKANAEDCPACAVERRNLPYPFLCPAAPADQAQQTGEAR